MSYKDRLSDLQREGATSLTQQLVDLISRRDRRRRAGPGREAAADARAGRARRRQPPDRGARVPAPARARRGQRRRSGAAPSCAAPARPSGVRRSATRSPGSATRCRRPTRPTATACSPRCTGSRPARAWCRFRSAIRRSDCSRSRGAGRRDRGGPARAARRGACSTPTSRACRARRASSRRSRPSAARPRTRDDILITNGAAQGLALAMPRDPAPGRRRRLRGPELHGRDALDARQRRRDRRRPERRRRARRRRARGAALAARDPARRAAAAAAQPDRPRPFRRAPRAPARARAPPRLLHPRGRDLRRPAVRRRAAAVAALAGAGARRLRRLALEDRWPAGCGSAGSPPAARCSTGSWPRSAPTTSTARRSPSSPWPATWRAVPTPGRPSAPATSTPAASTRCARRSSATSGRWRSYVEPLGGGHLWLSLDLALDERELADEAVRQGVAYVPGNALRIDEVADLQMRLSFGFLEPEQIDEGLRRLAVAIRALRARPARRRAVPV